MRRARSILEFCLLMLLLLPGSALGVCRDGVLDSGESCDDANAVRGDGCSPACQLEPLCLVAPTTGPSSVTVVPIAPNGAFGTPIATPIAGTPVVDQRSAARCGRSVYVATAEEILGFEVGLDGSLAALPGPTARAALELVCDEDRSLLVALGSATLGSFHIGGSGELVAADSEFIGIAGGRRMDRHPLTGDFYGVTNIGGSISGSGSSLVLQRWSFDAAGMLAAAEARAYLLDVRPRAAAIAFTADAGFLALPGIATGDLLVLARDRCFGQIADPATPLPDALDSTCDGPLAGDASPPDFLAPTDFRAFAPRPEGGDLFYYQGAAAGLHTGAFSGDGVVSLASIPPVHETSQLLPAFGGRVLLSLGPGEVASYDVADDLVTLTPHDNVATAAATLEHGVLVPCPDTDADADGVFDAEDNCLGRANPTQRDTNQDGFGNDCDPDYDDDGAVGLPDFNRVRQQFGKRAGDAGYDDEVELDGDGAVGLSDFNVFRGFFGRAPGPSGLGCAGTIPCPAP